MFNTRMNSKFVLNNHASTLQNYAIINYTVIPTEYSIQKQGRWFTMLFSKS